MEDNDIKLEIKPKFNLLYEFWMPTGKKIKKTLIVIILMIIAMIVLKLDLVSKYLNSNTYELLSPNGLICNILLIAIFITFVILTILIVFQILQYNGLKYVFYKTKMEYFDSFLNQQRKTLKYENIREVELRRTIIDRIFNFGIIILYTNAEKNTKTNGVIMYAIKNAKQVYHEIEVIMGIRKEENN